MEFIYYLLLGAIAFSIAGLELISNRFRINSHTDFRSFKIYYLIVYSLMMAGQCLQGPFDFQLYEAYGMSYKDAQWFLILKFFASMVAAPILGSLADIVGRKAICLTYCITNILNCVAMHFAQLEILFVGRILAGIATSILISTFESWLVAEHVKRGFGQRWLYLTFSQAIFFGNGLVAVVSVLFGTFLVDSLHLSKVSLFDAAGVILVIGMAVIFSSWTENYGETSQDLDDVTVIKNGFVAIFSDKRIALLGAIQFLFESTMYTVLYYWTPALTQNGEDIAHGFIYATLMLALMLGSSIASRLLSRNSVKVESYMQIVFVAASVSIFLALLANSMVLVLPSGVKGGSFSSSWFLQYLGFCIFEFCVGIFLPSIMMMRSQYIPEGYRCTIMNIFQFPVYLFVCIALYYAHQFPVPITAMFSVCIIFLAIAAILQRWLSQLGSRPRGSMLELG